MPAETPLPARLEAEPAIWYRRFVAWLQGGPQRSVLAIYNAEREAKGLKRLDGVPSSWREAEKEWIWSTRAATYDKAEAERLNIELAERREAWRKTEETMAYALVNEGRKIITGKQTEKINPRTNKPYTQAEIAGLFDAGKVRAATACFDAASTIARRALEMIDKRINLNDLTDAEIMRLLALDAAQAKPNDGPTP